MKRTEKIFVNPLLAMAFAQGVDWLNDPDITVSPPERRGPSEWAIIISDDFHEEDDKAINDDAESELETKSTVPANNFIAAVEASIAVDAESKPNKNTAVDNMVDEITGTFAERDCAECRTKLPDYKPIYASYGLLWHFDSCSKSQRNRDKRKQDNEAAAIVLAADEANRQQSSDLKVCTHGIHFEQNCGACKSEAAVLADRKKCIHKRDIGSNCVECEVSVEKVFGKANKAVSPPTSSERIALPRTIGPIPKPPTIVADKEDCDQCYQLLDNRGISIHAACCGRVGLCLRCRQMNMHECETSEDQEHSNDIDEHYVGKSVRISKRWPCGECTNCAVGESCFNEVNAALEQTFG